MTDLAVGTARTREPLDPDSGGLESAAGTSVQESRFPCLDGYRTIAAFLVVLTHVGFETARSVHGVGYSILSRGDIGVPLFFVLSGFLLYRPMARARLSAQSLPRVGSYLWRRALRIVPAFWVSVVVVLLVLASDAGPRHQLSTWLLHLGFAQVYPASDPTRGLEQDWSLAVEASFYVTLPWWPRLLRLLTSRRTEPSLAVEFVGAFALLVISIAWIILDHGTHHVLGYQVGNWLPEHLDWFAGGMLLAVLSVLPSVRPDAARRLRWIYELADAPGTCMLLAAAVYTVALTPLAGPYALQLQSVWEAVTKELLYGAFAVLFLIPGCLGDQRRGLSRAVLRTPVMRKLGEVSYGFFLWHVGVLFYLRQLLHQPTFTENFGEMFGLTVGFSLILATASYYLIEQPALRLKDRWPRQALRARSPRTP